MNSMRKINALFTVKTVTGESRSRWCGLSITRNSKLIYFTIPGITPNRKVTVFGIRASHMRQAANNFNPTANFN